MAQEESQAVDTSAAQDAVVTDSAPVEEPSLDVVTEGPELNPNNYREETEEDVEDVADDTAEPEAPVETEEPQESDKPLAPKSENRFQKLANENRELREALAQVEARKTQVAAEQELLNEINPETGDYYTPTEAERIARQFSLQKAQAAAEEETQNIQFQQFQYQVNQEADQIPKDFPIFDESNRESFNKEVAASAAQAVEHLLIRDANGQVVGARASLYPTYKAIAQAFEASAVANQIKGQKATEKMLSQSDNLASAKPSKANSKDDKEMSPTEYAKSHGLKTVW